MQIPRVYLPSPLADGKQLELDKQTARHIITVLRLKSGAPLIIFDGQGNAHQATLENSTRITVGRNITDKTESPLQIHLIQAISRGERMDQVVQKATELGVNRITPLLSQRCMVKLTGDRATKRLQHWQNITISACEQCGRNRLPLIGEVTTLNKLLSKPESGLKIVLDPAGQSSLSTLSPPKGLVTLLIGPEGGLSDKEIRQAQQQEFVGLKMGPRILRTETAAISSISALQTLWGDLG